MEFQDLKKSVSFRTSRSSGAGGQHVNKVETKVEVLFNISEAEFLSDLEKSLARRRLSKRINKEGVLIVSNQSSRSQIGNKEAALKTLFDLLKNAIKPPKKRKKVKPLVAEKNKRLKAKKRKSEIKAGRKKIDYCIKKPWQLIRAKAFLIGLFNHPKFFSDFGESCNSFFQMLFIMSC